jgi:hypothetical protein
LNTTTRLWITLCGFEQVLAAANEGTEQARIVMAAAAAATVAHGRAQHICILHIPSATDFVLHLVPLHFVVNRCRRELVKHKIKQKFGSDSWVEK